MGKQLLARSLDWGANQIGSTTINGQSGQSLPLSYRLGSDILLRDGFE